MYKLMCQDFCTELTISKENSWAILLRAHHSNMKNRIMVPIPERAAGQRAQLGEGLTAEDAQQRRIGVQ